MMAARETAPALLKRALQIEGRTHRGSETEQYANRHGNAKCKYKNWNVHRYVRGTRHASRRDCKNKGHSPPCERKSQTSAYNQKNYALRNQLLHYTRALCAKSHTHRKFPFAGGGACQQQ